MKITTLIENKPTPGLAGEHGLSIHIDYNGKQYLLDTGASNKYLANAEMGEKPEEVKELGKRLIELKVLKIYTGHCTGEPAYALLKEELGDRLQYLSTGTIIEI